MQALKALVIGLGILIFVGMAVVGITIYKRATAPETARASATVAEGVGEPLPVFGTADVSMPRGAHIQEMVAEGDRLMLRLRLRDGSPTIMVIDLKTGELLGTVNVRRNQ